MFKHEIEPEIKSTRLADLSTGSRGVIVHVLGQGAFRKRISEMGFVKGQMVKVIKNAPMKDPVEYEIMGYKVSLRRSEADLIEVVSPSMAKELVSHYEGTIDEHRQKLSGVKKGKTITDALVGNPNSGKTTFVK